MEKKLMNRDRAFRVIAILFSLVFILSSCSSTKKNLQRDIVHDTLIHTEYINKIQYDSVYMHDSIYMYMQNDTIYKTIYKDIYKYKYLTDTMHLMDTVYLYKTKEKEIVKADKSSDLKGRIRSVVILLLLIALLWEKLKDYFHK